MKKRFIVLADLTEDPENLISYASAWAKEISAELLIVYESPRLVPGFADPESKKSILMEAQEEALNRLKDIVYRVSPIGLKVDYEYLKDNIQNTVGLLLNESDYENLLFVGVKRMGMIEKFLFGSKALQTIGKFNTNIVALPRDFSNYTHEKIYVAVTEQYQINILELHNLLKFIDPQNTSITFFYLSKPGEETHAEEKILKELSELFSDRYNTSYAIYEGQNPFEDIKKVINNKIDEILVVQKGSRMWTDQVFRKFLVDELVYEGKTPLIVLP